MTERFRTWTEALDYVCQKPGLGTPEARQRISRFAEALDDIVDEQAMGDIGATTADAYLSAWDDTSAEEREAAAFAVDHCDEFPRTEAS